jgi:2-polyprenyl-6-methoxyphenol hydroxylase-like FAD-dependent oxidoreductase
VTLTFGAQGMFGYAPSTSLSAVSASLMWWSTYEIAEPPPQDILLSDVQSQLSERHASWKSPSDDSKEPRIFSTLVTLACGSQSEAAQATATERDVLILPVYTTPRLTHWCSSTGKIVLMGDAAHTMPPDAGQGVSCAVEDVVAFSRLLGHYWNGQGDSELASVLKLTAKGYESVRMARVNRILDEGERKALGKKNKKWWQEWLRDWILWVVCKSLRPKKHRNPEY